MIKISPRSNQLRIACLLAGVLLTGTALPQSEELKLPISLDADSTDYDGKSSMLMFRGLRLTQGSIGIQADEGRASKLDFEDSVWHFAGNVIVDIDSGHIECDSADLRFSGHVLQSAIISGSPATFQMQRPESDTPTYAEAGRLEYDFKNGIVTFSENATISEGGNQISSAYLVYNVAEQRINAQSGGDGDPKVRITYTPGANESLLPAEQSDPDATSPQQDEDPNDAAEEFP